MTFGEDYRLDLIEFLFNMKNYNIIKNTLVYYMNFYNEVIARRPKSNEYEYDYEEDVIKLQALNELTRERKISGNR